jgi:hypothetical protein
MSLVAKLQPRSFTSLMRLKNEAWFIATASAIGGFLVGVVFVPWLHKSWKHLKDSVNKKF